MKASTPAPGFKAQARSGRWGRRQRSSSSTPASATPSPTRPATPTRPRPPPTETPSSRPSTTWKTSSPACRILEQESTVEDRAVAAAQHSFNLSNQRYKGGVTSYLEVLTAEATLLQNQRTAIDLQPGNLSPASAWSAPSAAAGMQPSCQSSRDHVEKICDSDSRVQGLENRNHESPNSNVMYQGTTSVVPQRQLNECGL